jgi:DNA topoisomerase II
VNERKVWLAKPGHESIFISHSQKNVSIEEFVSKDLIHYSHDDLIRSIPSAVDGLKPSQRKVLFTCLTKAETNKNQEIKVVQLGGAITELTAYHHGDKSLTSSIVRMAQDYVGSNNLPLLLPCGQFGTRHYGGKDAASARYIFTKLSPLTPLIFPASDNPILEYVIDDGKKVEPKFYLPIIPMVLVNGGQGIGTGWSTTIHLYNPLHITRRITNKLQ